MYIEEIVLEGFKSYATRTVIPAWDPKFNAITGLNGSGKSNILDAICFVLGIDNLRQVRATSMQDLIYKRGQSGITKASVTIVFNNEDPEQCPIGYSDYPQITVTRQIVVGGKNKYLVNGHNAANKVIENLFQSVQLNVNNPHFLIMQGQITKVLNMKPPEILALIEETAGTRMFEDRRGKALQTLEKKDKKMEEIEALRRDIIEPKLSILRQERWEFLEFKRTETEIDNLRKILISFNFYKKGENISNFKMEIGNLEKRQISISAEESEIRIEMQKIENELENIVKSKTNSTEVENIKRIEGILKETRNSTTRVETQIELENEFLINSKREIENNLNSLKKDEKLKKEFDGNLKELKEKLILFKKEHEKVLLETGQTEELLQSLETGVSISDDGKAETGYGKLLRDLRGKLSETTVSLKGTEIRIAEIDEELKEINPKFEKFKKESNGTIQKLNLLKSEIEQLSLLNGSSKEEEKEKEEEDIKRKYHVATDRKKELEREAAEYREIIDKCRGKVSNISFKYSDPVENFDRRKVKGLVAELVRLEDKVAIKYGLALEIAAGGRLYNVVVESDIVAGQLLEKGRLQKRVTIIPLNKIVPKVMGVEKTKRAQQLAPGRVHPALELVGSCRDVEQAIKYVFGGTFICDDAEAANIVAFDGSISSRAVTLDGDIYEPSGTLTGGSRQSSGSAILESLSRFKEAQERLAPVEEEIKMINIEICGLEVSLEASTSQSERLSLLKHELSMLQRQFEQNVQGKLMARKERLEQEKGEILVLKAERQVERDNLEESIRQSQREADDFTSNRTGKLESIKAALKRAKMTLQKESDRLSHAEREFDTKTADLMALNDKISRNSVAIEECEEKRMQCEQNIKEYEGSLQESKLVQQKLESELESARLHLLRFDHEISALTHQKSANQSRLERISMERMKIAGEMAKLKEGIVEGEKELQEIMKKNAWIEDNRKHFNVKGGQFDFGTLNFAEEKKKLAILEERQTILKRNVNVNVLEMIDRVETRDNTLVEMLKTVKKDKQKISKTIDALDDIKKETLQKTWKQVNEDFGMIFNDLLPGNWCKLDGTSEGLQGLEIKVKLGGVWKESLTELSGGQRSLTALALILSLLKYRPAPFYILDEVDAALDLSHTQNIGNLLKKRFKSSQFIVVSLKEGMFTNANVLFKTKFRDGISSIDRTEQQQHSRGDEGENDNNMNRMSEKNKNKKSTNLITKKSVKLQ